MKRLIRKFVQRKIANLADDLHMWRGWLGLLEDYHSESLTYAWGRFACSVIDLKIALWRLLL